MDENEESRKALKRVKDRKQAEAKKQTEPQIKEPSEADRLFDLIFPEASHWKADYSQPLAAFDPITYVPYLKQVALAILDTGIIGENGLKGHALHKKPLLANRRDIRDLISALVDIDYQYQQVIYSPGDIINLFDSRFDIVAAFARIGGVKNKEIKKTQQKWGKEISLAVAQGKFPPNWRELTKVEIISSYKYRPKSEAQALAIKFLQYVPQAPTGRIVTWVNMVLKALGRRPVSKSKLHDYISSRKQEPILPGPPISITE